MHRDLCQQLLADEVTACNRGRLRARLANDVLLDEDGRVVFEVETQYGRQVLTLQGDNYDAEPLGLSAIDPDTRQPLPEDRWPARLRSGLHPITQEPWYCMRGLAEYYIHPSHVSESWDQDRVARRLEVVIGHLLDRMEVPA